MLFRSGDIFEYLKSNRARPLGVTSAERIALIPNVPTIAETVPGYESATWVSIFAPAGMSKELVDRLNTEFSNALRDPGTASKLSALTYDPVLRKPEEFAVRLKADYEKIGKLFREAGVKLD